MSEKRIPIDQRPDWQHSLKLRDELIAELRADLAAAREYRKRLVGWIRARREAHDRVVKWFKLNSQEYEDA